MQPEYYDIGALEYESLEEKAAFLATALQKVSNALAAILDFKEMETWEFVDAYAPGLTWGELAANARAALREAEAGGPGEKGS